MIRHPTTTAYPSRWPPVTGPSRSGGPFTGGPYAAAAALVHTLARYRWPERINRPSQTRASPCLPHGTAAPQ